MIVVSGKTCCKIGQCKYAHQMSIRVARVSICAGVSVKAGQEESGKWGLLAGSLSKWDADFICCIRQKVEIILMTGGGSPHPGTKNIIPVRICYRSGYQRAPLVCCLFSQANKK